MQTKCLLYQDLMLHTKNSSHDFSVSPKNNNNGHFMWLSTDILSLNHRSVHKKKDHVNDEI